MKKISRNSKVRIMDVWRKIRVVPLLGYLEKPPGMGEIPQAPVHDELFYENIAFQWDKKLDHVPSFTMTLYAALLCSSFLPEKAAVSISLIEHWVNTKTQVCRKCLKKRQVFQVWTCSRQWKRLTHMSTWIKRTSNICPCFAIHHTSKDYQISIKDPTFWEVLVSGRP